jgi:hypothetical protein
MGNLNKASFLKNLGFFFENLVHIAKNKNKKVLQKCCQKWPNGQEKFLYKGELFRALMNDGGMKVRCRLCISELFCPWPESL